MGGEHYRIATPVTYMEIAAVQACERTLHSALNSQISASDIIKIFAQTPFNADKSIENSVSRYRSFV